ncbi:hypothetical protein GQ43DRAFT_435752 [Delitschia confertaspora ATCC 74209]|uniref:Uncharacterized protein n=1 Tax=Delitschia confertaspora ATCC 74209 TaxID=1513339 RepID=A0A9P4JC34_9PLEO|nr:hypothetical protein GQ43DRAFT_435752 [Delitschia confertaspora ATCC 74209]
MGLPLWPLYDDEDTKAITKVDATTAAARSPIRRRVRGSPGIGSRRVRRSDDAHATITRTLQRSPRLSDTDFLVSGPTAEHYRIVDDAGHRHARLRFPPPPVPESRNFTRDEVRDRIYNMAHGPRTQASRDAVDAMRRRAAEHREHHRVADENHAWMTSIWGPLPPLSPRTSTNMSNVLRRNVRDLPALTPNFAPAGLSSTRESAEDDSQEERGPAPGPESRRLRYPRSSGRIFGQSPLSPDILIIEDSEENSGDDNAVGFPPLRRMGRRDIVDGPLPSSSLRESWSPTTTLDGLGDRERSFSPVDDHWETLLTTVAEDPVAPTADSSFTSAAASASFSNSHSTSRTGSASNSASSSRTHLTVPSRRNSRNGLLTRACESDDDSPSDTEVESQEPSNLRRASTWRRTLLLADEPPSRNPERYSRSVRDRSSDFSRSVRGLYSRRPESQLPSAEDDHIRHRADSTEQEMQALDRELQQARGVLERLSRRVENTDGLWAYIGLTQPLADRFERIEQQRRER